MRPNRRDLLMGGLTSGPGALLGFNFTEMVAAQEQSQAQVDHDVVNFWVRGMGVPANAVIGGERTRGRFTPDRLLSAADTEVTFQLVRMWLNQADDATFRSYSSGGIYVDLQRGAGQTLAETSTAPSLMD